jgi:hypothetical protein
MHVGSSGVSIASSPDSNFLEPIAIGMVGALLGSITFMLAPPCYKFPDLKLVWSEGGIGWIPAALERADRQFDRHNYWAKVGDTKPSDIFRHNMYVCMIEEPVGLGFREHIGVDRIFWELDYPHADTPWPHAQKQAESLFAGVPGDEVEAICHANAERVFRWEMADESLASAPDVETWRDTLRDDPYAAMRLRHDVSGIDHVDTPDDGTCTELVLATNIYERCGLPLGEDGRCAAGHGPAAS